MSDKATLVHLPYVPGSKDYSDSVTAGYYGYAIILTMSVLNFVYYGDVAYRRIILGKWQHWGGMLHTIWGVQGVIRPLANYLIWAIVGLYAAMAIVDSPNTYVMLGQVAGMMGFAYALRTFLIIMIMVFGIIGDNPKKYTQFGADYEDSTLFRALYSWGNELRLYGAQSNTLDETDESADEYYYMIDIQLEAFNIVAGAAAYSFFDIGLKIWEPLAKMGINFVPKDMKYFRKALFLKKLKIYERKFKEGEKAEAEPAAEAVPEDEDIVDESEGDNQEEAF